MSERAKEILEAALEKASKQFPGRVEWSDLTVAVREALAALDAEGVGLPWKPAPPMRERGSMPPVVLWRSPEGHQFQVAPSEFGALWASHYCELSALVPLPGQSPEPSAGLREALEMMRRVRLGMGRMLRDRMPADVSDMLAWAEDLDRGIDAALRAEEQSHE